MERSPYYGSSYLDYLSLPDPHVCFFLHGCLLCIVSHMVLELRVRPRRHHEPAQARLHALPSLPPPPRPHLLRRPFLLRPMA
uniref:Uncharacterized protein n=1 Tax=Brassica oleracea TaxID=3712 RepID=A0A3P6DSQ8_BRAOL|nr:unnamed protein product [Brassica oleracea]